MSKRTMILFAIGWLLVGAFAGIAGAQAVLRTRYVDSGLFSVAKGQAFAFYVSLDDHRSGPPTRVLLSIFDHRGAVVAQDDVTLQPGQSTSLQFQQAGLFRVHAQADDSSFPLSFRRSVHGNVELFDLDDLGVGIQSVCTFSHDDGIGSTRPQ